MSEQTEDFWMTTFTGKKFYPLAPRVEDICVEDVAHALANTCRFGGHCRKFYSVAQHSVLVSQNCIFPFEGLMHDATEAYLSDLIRPVKCQMPFYREVEERLWKVIAEKYGLPLVMHPEVKEADTVLLFTEKVSLCTPTKHKWALEDQIKPLDKIIYPLDPEAAEGLFLARFHELEGNVACW